MSDNPFRVMGTNEQTTPVTEGASVSEQIKTLVDSNKVFLFMKGNPMMPQCGFSANIVSVLMNLGIDFQYFDVLSDMDIRQGIKDFANWPTIPQLYVKGEFVGGNDIVNAMAESGELQEVVTNA